MKRRQFLGVSIGGAIATTLARMRPSAASSGRVVPLPAVTAAVDTIIPRDPSVPNDFCASDFGTDRLLAARLGVLGQVGLALYLNAYALRVARRLWFSACTPEERHRVLAAWIENRNPTASLERELLDGLLMLTTVLTFEQDEAAVQQALYESMTWYDPNDPDGSFRIPLEGFRGLTPNYP